MTTTIIPVSTVPAVMAYLNTVIPEQLAQDPNASSILFTLIDPGDKNLPNEIISLNGVHRPQVKPATFIGSGAQFWLNEEYDIEGLVSIFTGSTDQSGATTIALAQLARAWQLLGYVETAVREDPSLGDLVNQAHPSSTVQPQPTWSEASDESPSGVLTELTFYIHVDVLN